MFNRTLRNAGTILSGKVVVALLGLATTGLAMRSLGLEAFGTLLLIHAFARTAASLTRFQSWQAVLRYGAPSLEHGRWPEFRALLRFTAALDLVAAVMGAIACAMVIGAFGQVFSITPGLQTAAIIYTTSVMFMVTATATGVLRLFDRFDLLATREALEALVRLAGTGLAAVFGGDLVAFLAVWYGATMIGGATLVFAAWSQIRRRGLLSGGWTGLPRATSAHPGLWSFVWTTNFTSSLSLVSGHLGTLCVGAMLGPAEAALFAIARQIGEAALKPSRFLSPAIYPEIARLAALDDRAGIRSLIARMLCVSTGASAVLFTVLALLGGFLLRLVGGTQAEAAYPVMLLLAIASAIGFASFALEPLLMSMDRQGAALRARIAACLVYVPAALLGLHLIGLQGVGGAAITTAFVTLAAQLGPATAILRASGRPIGPLPS